MDKFIESLAKLDDEELFEEKKTILLEDSNVVKNLGFIDKMLGDITSILKGHKELLYEDERIIIKNENTCIRVLGEILDKISS